MFSDSFLQSTIRTALARGGDYCDVFVEERDDTAIAYDSGKIKEITTGTTAGVGIRVIYGINYVYLYSGNPTEATLTQLAERAAAAVKWEQAGNLGEIVRRPARDLVRPK
ncbi:MAG TPA: DNA gyrase modulator, partial [Spirochaetia bacterium]|nr:DNA gyrase modulator [Spirochaetia bacterium]